MHMWNRGRKIESLQQCNQHATTQLPLRIKDGVAQAVTNDFQTFEYQSESLNQDKTLKAPGCGGRVRSPGLGRAQF